MGVLEVEIYVSEQNDHNGQNGKKSHLHWPVPLNAVVEEGIGHQVGDNGKVVDGDVPPHAAGVLVQNQVRQGSVFGCC